MSRFLWSVLLLLASVINVVAGTAVGLPSHKRTKRPRGTIVSAVEAAEHITHAQKFRPFALDVPKHVQRIFTEQSKLPSDTPLWNTNQFQPTAIRNRYVAGLPNSGTNLAFAQIFVKNCRFSGGFEPPFHKHTVVSPEDKLEHTDASVLVVVKHPLTWLKSMCRIEAGVYFTETMTYYMHIRNKTKCASSEVSFRNPTGRKPEKWMKYPSLLDLWSDFHIRYLGNLSFPVEFVRYEDLLLHPVETTRVFCPRPMNQISVHEEASKGHGAVPTDRESALQKYGDQEKILSEFDPSQLAYIRGHVDHDLLSFFGYAIPD
jgi:hypothetical protein